MYRNPKISVLVPVYNAEKYLRRCVDSILAQTFTDFEVLLINDGSTDSSGAICDEYKSLDKRVRVFHKENGGVSSARNVGLKNMRGIYSIHCDSDDMVAKEMLQVLYSEAIATKSDVVLCDYLAVNKEKSTYICQKPTSCQHSSVSNGILVGNLHGSTWNKLIRSALIKHNNLFFDERISYCEDVLFNINILLLHPKISYVNQAFYSYIQVEDSITNSKLSDKEAKQFKYYCEMLFSLLKKYNEYEEKIFSFHVLRVKYIILNSGFSDMRWLNDFFPISDKYIWEVNLSLPIKIILWLLSNRFYYLASALNKIRFLKINYDT